MAKRGVPCDSQERRRWSRFFCPWPLPFAGHKNHGEHSSSLKPQVCSLKNLHQATDSLPKKLEKKG
jgi:hypothetical protein